MEIQFNPIVEKVNISRDAATLICHFLFQGLPKGDEGQNNFGNLRMFLTLGDSPADKELIEIIRASEQDIHVEPYTPENSKPINQVWISRKEFNEHKNSHTLYQIKKDILSDKERKLSERQGHIYRIYCKLAGKKPFDNDTKELAANASELNNKPWNQIQNTLSALKMTGFITDSDCLEIKDI